MDKICKTLISYSLTIGFLYFKLIGIIFGITTYLWMDYNAKGIDFWYMLKDPRIKYFTGITLIGMFFFNGTIKSIWRWKKREDYISHSWADGKIGLGIQTMLYIVQIQAFFVDYSYDSNYLIFISLLCFFVMIIHIWYFADWEKKPNKLKNLIKRLKNTITIDRYWSFIGIQNEGYKRLYFISHIPVSILFFILFDPSYSNQGDIALISFLLSIISIPITIKMFTWVKKGFQQDK